jgi:hypothetical protein
MHCSKGEYKKTNNDLQNTTQKTMNTAYPDPHKHNWSKPSKNGSVQSVFSSIKTSVINNILSQVNHCGLDEKPKTIKLMNHCGLDGKPSFVFRQDHNGSLM